MKALVLAGGFPQIALIKELKSRGYTVLLADYNEDPVAKPYADVYFRVSTLDIEAITDIAREEKVDMVITVCTDQALHTVACVSERLGLPCYIDSQTALNVTNKSYMKQVFADHRIPTARHRVLTVLDDSVLRELDFPMIVKPADCNSSKGVRKVYDADELREAFDEAVSFSRTDTAIVEEFVEGREITVDVQITGGRARVLSMAYSDKIGDDDKFVIYRTRFPVSEPEEICRRIEDSAQRIADAFGLRDSLMLMQLISDGERINILEFSARTGGGVKHLLIKKVCGFDVIGAAVDLTLGRSPSLEGLRGPETKYITNTFVYCRPGIFDRLEGFEELMSEGIITEYHQFKKPGTAMGEPRSSGDRIAVFTVQSDSLEEQKRKYREAADRIRVRDTEGEDIARHDLMVELVY